LSSASPGRGTRLGRGRRPVERFNELGEVEVDGLGQASRPIPRLVVWTRLGAHDAAIGSLSLLVGHRIEVAVEDEVDHSQYDLASLVGQGRNDPGVFPGAGLDLFLHGMGDEKESVGEEGQLGEDSMEFVVDQGPALAVAEVGLMLDLELGADVVAAHPVGVVDRIDDDGLERMLALGDLTACGEQLVP